MQQRARVQHNPIKSATTVLSEEQRAESERKRFREKANERWGKKQRESRLNSQIKGEWVRDVFIHQKLQTPTHGFSSGLSVPWRSLMNWWAEGVWRKREWERERKGVKKKNLLPPTPHHNHHHPLKRISQHAMSSPQYSVRKIQEINKSTKPGLFKYHAIIAVSTVGEQKLEYAFR